MDVCQRWRLGSPPHTRGKARAEFLFPVDLRITPAHAGKRRSPGTSSPPPWDHPRTRGEKNKTIQARIKEQGSPPHTRGKGIYLSRVNAQFRITPAHAGKSGIMAMLAGLKKDNPRTRGEKVKPENSTRDFVGSPPHTRGKGAFGFARDAQTGITPAHAGKSRSARMTKTNIQDHPRTRGEK